MAVFSTIFCFLFILLSLSKGRSRALPSFRECFLAAFVIWGVLMVAASETLSLFSFLVFPWVFGFWAAAAGVAAAVFFILPTGKKPHQPSFPEFVRKQFFSLPWPDRFSFFVSGFILMMVGLTAWVAAPNTWDSLTYHMSRVAHWAQNHSLQPYATQILRQICFAPGAELAILNFQILAGSDRWANMIQWGSMLGAVVGVSLIARELGAGRRGQIFSSLLTATIPMGILQASGTQNDYAVSFWLVCFVYFLLKLKNDWSWPSCLLAAVSLGLATFTKTTAPLYATPFLVWFVLSSWKKKRRELFLSFLVIGTVVLLINSGQYKRNFSVFGNPLGPARVAKEMINEEMSAKLFSSNLLRNVALHAGTSIKPLNRAMETGVLQIHKLLKLDIIDPRVSFASYPFAIPVTLHEDGAGNLCHFILFLASWRFLWLTDRRKNKQLFLYGVAVVSAFLLFVLVLKWQPFHSRLHLPMFVLSAAFIAGAWDDIFSKKKFLFLAVCVIFTVTATPYVFRNSARKLISSKRTIFQMSRIEKYFANDSTRLPPFRGAVNFLADQECRQVGLFLSDNSWEYPFWAIFKEKGQPFRLEHVNVKNEAGQDYPLGPFEPCGVIAFERGELAEILVGKDRYPRKRSFDSLTVFTKK